MKLSTRSRYGVRLMIALASEAKGHSLFLKDIAASECISEKYLSLIVIPLRAAGLIRSIRGARGGYVLARKPDDISLCDIVEALEGETSLVACVRQADMCERAPICPARETWTDLSNTIRNAMSSVKLDMLAARRSGKLKLIHKAPRSAKKASAT